MRRAGALPPAWIAGGAYLLLLVVWAMATPPWAVPDEAAQQVKAVALAHGQLGSLPHYTEPPRSFDESWFRSLTRVVDIPTRNTPPRQLPCVAFAEHSSAACLDAGAAGSPWALDQRERLAYAPPATGGFNSIEAAMIARLDVVAGDGGEPVDATTTYLGTYQPFVYVVPGVAASLGSSPTRSLYLGRLADVAVCGALLAAGVALLCRRRADLGVVAALVAITPAVLFFGGSLSASGIEILSGFCLAAALAAFTRPDGDTPRWGGVALVASAGLLAVVRPLGPLWLALAVGVTLASIGVRRAWEVVRANRAVALSAVAAIGVGAVVEVWWSTVVQPRPPSRPESVATNARSAVDDVPTLAREAVGVFGWVDTRLPAIGYIAWYGVVVLLVVLALAAGRRRERIVTVGVVVALLVISVGVTAAVAYPVGARAQGRWFLPIAVMLPVLLVEQIGRRRAGRDPWRWRVVAVVAVGTVVAAVQALALWVSARRDAVGIDGPFQFVGHSQWAPPLGWGVWLLLGGLGCAALALSAVQAVRIGDRSASGSGPVAATPAVRG